MAGPDGDARAVIRTDDYTWTMYGVTPASHSYQVEANDLLNGLLVVLNELGYPVVGY